jgi:hypothetical protein
MTNGTGCYMFQTRMHINVVYPCLCDHLSTVLYMLTFLQSGGNDQFGLQHKQRHHLTALHGHTATCIQMQTVFVVR